jgi:hypothetical protein
MLTLCGEGVTDEGGGGGIPPDRVCTLFSRKSTVVAGLPPGSDVSISRSQLIPLHYTLYVCRV